MEQTEKKRINIALLAARIAIITAASCVFAAYAAAHHEDWPVYDLIGPFFALFLFAFVLVAAVPKLIELLTGADEFPEPKEKFPIKTLLLVMLGAFVFHLFAMTVGMLIYSTLSPSEGFSGVFRYAWMKQNTDAGHYITIANDWYVSEGDDKLLIVFFPMLPVLIRGLNLLTHDGFISAQIINLLATTLLSGTAYLTFRSFLGEKRAVIGAFIALLLPGAVFFNSPMTEPLFLLFTLAAFYFMQKKRFLIAGVFVALSGFTRSLGVIAAVPLALIGVGHIIGLIREKKPAAQALILLVSGLVVSTFGTLGYLYINWSVHGDPFKFFEYQLSNWSQSSCPFFDTVRYIIDPYLSGAIASLNWDNTLALWGPQVVMIFASLIIMLFAAKKLPASYTFYFLFYFAAAVGCTWLLSSVRYLSAAVPLIAALALFCTKKGKTIAVFSVLGICYIGYLYMYMARMQVY